MYSTCRELISCTKCIEAKQMHFNFVDVILLNYGQKHVSVTSDFFENKNTIIIMSESLHTINETYNFRLKFNVE